MRVSVQYDMEKKSLRNIFPDQTDLCVLEAILLQIKEE